MAHMTKVGFIYNMHIYIYIYIYIQYYYMYVAMYLLNAAVSVNRLWASRT